MLLALVEQIALAKNLGFTIGLVVIFFVLFPLLAHGVIGFAVAQVLAERAENRRYREGLDDE